jgi:hypothetical protein
VDSSCSMNRRDRRFRYRWDAAAGGIMRSDDGHARVLFIRETSEAPSAGSSEGQISPAINLLIVCCRHPSLPSPPDEHQLVGR